MFPRSLCYRLSVVVLASLGVIISATGRPEMQPSAHNAPTATPTKLKIYISVDMEGIAGVVTSDQLGPTGFEYERFRRFMTNETLAAVQAAKDSGATEIVVSDSHGNGESLLVEEFPKDRKSTRLNSSHGYISYAVFCLKKKKNTSKS